jgi:hypothetical protein
MRQLCLIGCLVAAAGVGVATADVTTTTQVGNVIFQMPPGWGSEEQDGVTYTGPADTPEGKAVAVAIVPGQTLGGDFRAWFDARRAEVKGQGTVLDGGEVTSGVARTGFQFLCSAARLRDADEHTWITFLLVARAGDQVQPFVYITDDEALATKYQGAVSDFIASLSFANLAPPAPDPAPPLEQAPGQPQLPRDALSPSFTWGTVPKATGDAGLDGVYVRTGIEQQISLATGYLVGTVKHLYWCFLLDGRCVYGMPTEGLENFSYEVAARVTPVCAGTYNLEGDLGVIARGDTGHTTLALKRSGDKLIIGPDEGVFEPLDRCDGVALEGMPRRIDHKDEYGPKAGIRFTRDGRFTDEGITLAAVLSWGYPDHTERTVPSDPGEGTYRITNHSLELIYSDGRKKRVAFELTASVDRADPQAFILNSWRVYTRVD